MPEKNEAGLLRSILAVEGNAIQLHAVIDQPVTQLFGNDLLQRLKLGIDKFDHLAGFDVDQMIVMRLWRGLIARAAIAKIVTVKIPASSNSRTVRYTVAIEIFGSIAEERRYSSSTSGWSFASEMTRAITRRWSVMRSPRSWHKASRSIRVSIWDDI